MLLISAVYISIMITVNKELYSSSPTEWLYVLIQVRAKKATNPRTNGLQNTETPPPFGLHTATLLFKLY